MVYRLPGINLLDTEYEIYMKVRSPQSARGPPLFFQNWVKVSHLIENFARPGAGRYAASSVSLSNCCPGNQIEYPYFSKPKNARSKRAMEAREPKVVEDARTAIFVRGTHTGEVLNGVFRDLVRQTFDYVK